MPELDSLIYGELTKRQRIRCEYVGGNGRPPEPGTYATYRKMRMNPTMALARACARAPVASADHSYESDADVPPAQVAFIREQVDKQWRDFVKFALNAWDYGWQSFENVYRKTDAGLAALDWIKPLAPEQVTIELAEESDRVIGVIHNGVHLRGPKYALIQYDDEPGNPYGISRMEGLRDTAWWPWVNASRRLGQYTEKVAGVVMIMEHPTGKTETRDGTMLPNAEIAEKLGKEVSSGKPIGIPRTIDPLFEDALRTGKYDIAQLMAWQFKFLETHPGHGTEIIDTMKHYETLMVRGWLLPERAILEGKYGTKAEASAHGDIAVQVAEDFTYDIETTINEHVIDNLTWMNFGHRGKIRCRVSKLLDEELAATQALFDKILTNPTYADVIISTLDIDSMIDELGYARLKSMRNVIDRLRSEAVGAVNGGGEPIPEGDPLARRNGQVVQ